MPMHCQLFVPDFFQAAGAPAGERHEALETLLARGRCRRLAGISYEAWLFGRFGVAKQRDWPVAPYSLLADGGAPERHFWMRADPVHVRVGRDSAMLTDAAAFDVTRVEAESLVEALNRHFGDALLLYPLRPQRWYARLAQPPDAEAPPPRALRGSAIERHFHSGADALRVESLMNEAQMILHEHPVNAEREAHGAPAINSIWLWGGGTFSAPSARPFRAVVANDPLARGLALAAGLEARPLPRDAHALVAASGSEGVALVVNDTLRDAAGDANELRASLERDWVEPLLAALRSGRIGMLTLQLSGQDFLVEIETVRSDLRRFWRPRRPVGASLKS